MNECWFLFMSKQQSTLLLCAMLGCAKSFQSCPTLFSPMDCSLPGSSVHGILHQAYWSRQPFPSPGDIPNLGIEPRSLAVQADSLPAGSSTLLSCFSHVSLQPHEWQPARLLCPWDSPGKNTGVGCHFLLHQLLQMFIILGEINSFRKFINDMPHVIDKLFLYSECVFYIRSVFFLPLFLHLKKYLCILVQISQSTAGKV